MGIWQSSISDKVREAKLELNRSIRQLGKEQMRCEQEATTLVQKIKAEAKKGNMQKVRIMAKDLVRVRKMGLQYCSMSSQLNVILEQVKNVQSTSMLSSRLDNVNKIMSRVNKKTNIDDFQKNMQSLGRESMAINLKLDYMTETLDTTLGDADGEDEAETVITQILEDLGIENAAALPSVSAGPVKNNDARADSRAEPIREVEEGRDAPSTTPDGSDDADDIESRISKLRERK
ncbi:phosphopantothenoylcysteine decarboxylase [Babesia caballi]|uniref:Phosphopantothenoylcysteine decarboxylase n=1 Tax=Babesia caballi TaxID=5871 RepID=A0AAV4LTT4_BABCB|nr:phosphopantothenoylcysteine decarboxylase [Babesia caballi]